MNDSIIPLSQGLMAILSQDISLPKPFTHEIFLLEIVVAGTTHCPDIELIEDEIVPEKVLTLKREQNNPYDDAAIAIYCDTIRIGYVPADMNLICSRLMDAGKLFFCRVTFKKWVNSWLKIKANIYMVE